MNTVDQKRESYNKWIKIGIIAVGALIISPIIFMIVKGIVGIAIAGAVGLVLVNVAPYVSMKLANWKVRGIVAEANANPIETMTNLLIAKHKAFDVFRTNVGDAATAAKTFEQKCKQFSGQYPERANEFYAQLKAMNTLVERKKASLRDAQAMLATGDAKLVEMKAYWEMSQAANAANKAAGMDTGDQFELLKSDTACDAVFESMNRAFATLEVDSALDPNTVQTINAQPEVLAIEVTKSQSQYSNLFPTTSKAKQHV